jgi:hypothetical protein
MLGGLAMIGRILVELETPGDSRSMFRLRIDDKVVGDGLTAVQAHLLVGEVLDRITLPRRKTLAPEYAKQRELSAPVE